MGEENGIECCPLASRVLLDDAEIMGDGGVQRIACPGRLLGEGRGDVVFLTIQRDPNGVAGSVDEDAHSDSCGI